MNQCRLEDCNRQTYATGLCRAHYMQKWSGKEFTTPRAYRRIVDGKKVCPTCLIEQPLDNYYLRSNGYPCSRCKECMKALAARNRVRAAEKAQEEANKKNVAEDATQIKGDPQ